MTTSRRWPWVMSLVLCTACKGATSETPPSDAATGTGTGGMGGQIQNPPGSDGAGGAPESGTPSPGPGGLLEVRILDPEGKPTSARVNVIGADHAFYEPAQADNPLFAFSYKRSGMRVSRGPGRYWGSFFYTESGFQMRLPAGTARIEVDKGFAFFRSVVEATIVAEKKTAVDVTLRRLVDMPKEGWYGTDTHLHFERPQVEDLTLAKLLAGEDLHFGHSLSVSVMMGPLSKVVTAQAGGYGGKTVRSWGGYTLVSGNEHVTNTLGHVTQVMMSDLPAGSKEGGTIDQGPSLATLYDQTLALSGAMGHAHGGYSLEILPDMVLGKSDWVELLQFGIFRGNVTGGPDGIGLDKYYQALNSGYRYPLAGASDYPACRVLADSRSYVMGGAKPTFESMVGALLRGESFATSGPLLFLSVQGKGPGNQIELSGAGPHALPVKLVAASASMPMTELELVVNGKVANSYKGSATTFSFEKETTVSVDRSSWIAARAHGPHDVRAHTNPVWIYVDGETPFDPAAARQLQQNVGAFSPGGLGQDVTDTLARARTAVANVVGAGRNPKGPIPNYPRNSTTAPGTSGATLLPAIAARPGPLPVSSISGIVVGEGGAPVAGATVSAWGRQPTAQTGADGHFTLASLPGEEALFLRIIKTDYATTNTAYLNHHCEGSCLKVLLVKSATAEALMTASVLGTAIDELKKRPWVFFNVLDDKGMLKAGAAPAIAGGSVIDSHGVLGFVGAGGKPAGKATVANPQGGIQSVGFVPIDFAESPDEDNSAEPNIIVTIPGLGKDVVLPVFAGQVSYGAVTEGL